MSRPPPAQTYAVSAIAGEAAPPGRGDQQRQGFFGGVAFSGGFPYMNNVFPVADSLAKITQR